MPQNILYENMCRLCLHTDVRLKPIFGEDELTNLSRTIMACSVIKVIKGDGYPDHICYKCSIRLQNAFEFKQQCESSDCWLRESKLQHSFIQSINSSNTDLTLEAVVYNELSKNPNSQTKLEPLENVSQYMSLEVKNEEITSDLINEDDGNCFSLDQIETDRNNRKSLTCTICSESFLKLRDLRIHRTTHPPEFQCLICGRNFLSSSGYRVHLKSHRNDAANTECPVCHKKFKTYKLLKKHKIIHTGESQMTCTVCKKVFSKNGNLKRHMMIHEGTRPFVCHHCGMSFNQAVTLNSHVSAKHTGEQLFLSRNISVHHSHMKNKTMFTCKVCSKVLSTKLTLKYHMSSHSENPTKPFLCKECGKSFKNKNQLSVHERTHTGEQPYSCKICYKHFRQANHVYEHMFTHSGEKRHKCDVCSHAFALKGNLKAHMMTHTGETPFMCNVCGKGFYVANKLKQHVVKVHGK